MPRLSLYQSTKGHNYRFIDRQISQMFQVGGTDVYVHKYLGPKNPEEGTADQPIYDVVKETNIQDLLFLENRDRHYEQDIYRIRGIYNVQNIDFNLSQFGLFIDNDTIYMTLHINDSINHLGRKPISGDVMELPHLRDDFALNDYDISLPRYYVIEDVGRASEGFSATWYPHLYRIKLKKITDGQQFSDILDKPAGESTDMTLRELLSTKTKELEINDAILNQAYADAPLSGFETRQFYTLAKDPITGDAILNTTDMSTLDASNMSYRVSEDNARPDRDGYRCYLFGDGFPPNGYDFGTGISFPVNPGVDDFFLRVDFLPNRLFKFDGVRWLMVEDAVRMELTNTDTRFTQKTGFINNSAYSYFEKITDDIVALEQNMFIIQTMIDYQEAPFVVFKLDLQIVDVSFAEYPLIYSAVSIDGVDKLQVTLPVVNNEQIVIPFTGQWTVTLYNHREAQKQSLSKALKPRADL